MSYFYSLLANKFLNSIKKKFIALYILNVADIIFTLYLIRTGMFQEANIIMASIISNEVLSIILKLTIPLVLLVIIYSRMKDASIRQLLQSNRIIIGSLIFYGMVNASHILWFVMYKFHYTFL